MPAPRELTAAELEALERVPMHPVLRGHAPRPGKGQPRDKFGKFVGAKKRKPAA